jgi:DNA repair exonuclease SbcCD ATPase subunit
MQLLRLEVRNWCQHKHRVCTFTRGLVAIIGRIGSGKSNLLGAICWLLTGENPNAGVKAENVSQLSADGEPAHAILEFEHAGHLVVVTRHLLPEKEPATLLVDGTEIARGDKAVTAQIEKLLGIDSKFMSRFVIVAQNEIFAFIEDGATEVDKFFQKLFGTASAEKCHDLISKQLNKLAIPEIAESSAQLAAALPEFDQKLAAIEAEIAVLPTLDVFLNAQAGQQKIMNDWKQRTAWAAELSAVEQQLTSNAQNQQQLTEACEQYAADLAALKEAIAGNAESHTNAKVALSHLATYRQIAAARATAKTRLAEIAKIIADNPEPEAPSEEERTAAIAAVQAAEFELKQTESFVDTFVTSNTANCPTCHTPVTNLAAEIEKAQKAIPELTEKMEKARKTMTRALSAISRKTQWQTENQKLQAEQAQLADSLKSFAEISAPELSEDELVQLVSNHENLQKAYAEIEPLAQRAREKLATLTGTIAALDGSKQKLLTSITGLKVTAAEAMIAETTLTTLSEQYRQRQGKEQLKTQLQFEREKLVARIDAIRADEQKADALRRWESTAVVAKEALRAAPRLVAQRNLQKLETAINELLQIFSVDFFVKAATDDTPAFIAEFFDGRKQPAKRLSYGQKTVLALAFRVAVNALFAEEIGLLALDEPTAYLDQQRIKALAPVLEKLRELSTARGLQCLLVTHETSLSHLFESAVELDV